MFDYDKWQEIVSVVSKNKLRTALTAFGVFWGIFMLVVLMGAGNGLENGVVRSFTDATTNACYVWSQRASLPYKGLPVGRRVRLNNGDAEALAARLDGVEHIAPRCQLGGYRDRNNVTRGDKTGNFNVYGDYPQFQYVMPMRFTAGRFINDLDIRDKRKVAVIGGRVQELLFEADENPIGGYITIQGVFYKVVGVFKSASDGERATREEQSIYVPFSTFQQAFNYGEDLGWFAITALPGVAVSQVEEQAKSILKQRHTVHPRDVRAFGSYNSEEEYSKISGLFTGIRWFIWFVGIGTLLAGVIGVSNIMLIVVKERTREIGIRKAIGASPVSIISLVVQESLVVTAFAGYFGLVLGVALLETVSVMVGNTGGIFNNPAIDLGVALKATGVLIFAGLFAGVLPSWHAARINPILALRS